MTARPEAGVFHGGERAIQERTGARAQAARNGALIATSISGPAAAFLSTQPLLVIGGPGDHGGPTVSVVFGEPGFVTAPRPDLVEIRLDRSFLDRDAVARRSLTPPAAVGLLAIDLDRRRRLRINGRIARADETAILMHVHEAYPNCPTYIRRRVLTSVGPRTSWGAVPSSGRSLDEERRAVIAASDMCFVASAHPQRGADVSHRGGPAGFVGIVDDGTLRIADYAGNGMFNSLGNLLVDDRVGLAFLDFAGERLLRLSGRARLRFNDEAQVQTGRAAQRLVEVSIESWTDGPLDAAARWDHLDPSPFIPRPTTWPT